MVISYLLFKLTRIRGVFNISRSSATPAKKSSNNFLFTVIIPEPSFRKTFATEVFLFPIP
jgi:hypothetical protein